MKGILALKIFNSGEMFLFIKAWHIIAPVAWFAALFYLPRLFIYHSQLLQEKATTAQPFDTRGHARFQVMERRLYFYIMWPAGVVTTFLGIFLVTFNSGYYLKAGWMHAKLALVVLLWIYHGLCGYYLKCFRSADLFSAKLAKSKVHSTRFLRFFNEYPTLILVLIVLLVVLKPF